MHPEPPAVAGRQHHRRLRTGNPTGSGDGAAAVVGPAGRRHRS